VGRGFSRDIKNAFDEFFLSADFPPSLCLFAADAPAKATASRRTPNGASPRFCGVRELAPAFVGGLQLIGNHLELTEK